MKTYFVECLVKYTDMNEGDPYTDEEIYQYIIEAKSEKEARDDAKIQAEEQFDEELNNDEFENITIEIIDIYETSDDARQ